MSHQLINNNELLAGQKNKLIIFKKLIIFQKVSRKNIVDTEQLASVLRSRNYQTTGHEISNKKEKIIPKINQTKNNKRSGYT